MNIGTASEYSETIDWLLQKAELNAQQRQLLESCKNFFKMQGYLSPKQKAAILAIANKTVLCGV